MIACVLVLSLQLPLAPEAKTVVNAPYGRIGRSYQSLEEKFGARVRRFDVTAFKNPHTDVPGAQYVVDFGGVVITFFHGPSSPDILVTAIDVTDMKWLAALGVTLEGSRAEIGRRLGPPRRGDAATLHYEDEEGSDIGPTTMTLSFRGNRLARVKWTFPWD